MNRHHRGSGIASKFGSGRTQLKVENSLLLRTIWNFNFRESLIVAGQRFFVLKNRLKIKNRRSSLGGDTNIARKKSAYPLENDYFLGFARRVGAAAIGSSGHGCFG